MCRRVLDVSEELRLERRRAGRRDRNMRTTSAIDVKIIKCERVVALVDVERR